MLRVLAVFAGGGLGSLLRYWTAITITSRYALTFPLGTFMVNVSGSFLIGILMTLFTERFPAAANLRLLLVTGFLGGYTTFSSFEWEAYSATRNGNPTMGLLYVASSVVVGYLAVWLGSALALRRW